MKRFWSDTVVTDAEGGFQVLLDTRPVRTPAKRLCVLPNRTLADEVAAEWRAQEDRVDPLSMPVTRAASTCLDRVMPELDQVRSIIAAYGENDLLCYRAPHPPELANRQAAGWDPLIAWSARTLKAPLQIISGVMPASQPAESVSALADAVTEHSVWELTALSELVTISGSLVLGLAVTKGKVGAEPAWHLSRIDEEWNIEKWGEDHEAAQQAARRRTDFLAAARLLELLRAD